MNARRHRRIASTCVLLDVINVNESHEVSVGHKCHGEDKLANKVSSDIVSMPTTTTDGARHIHDIVDESTMHTDGLHLIHLVSRMLVSLTSSSVI